MMFSNISSRSSPKHKAPMKRSASSGNSRIRNKYKSCFEKFVLTVTCAFITLFVFKGTTGFRSTPSSSSPTLASITTAAATLNATASDSLIRHVKPNASAGGMRSRHGVELEVDERRTEESRPRKLMIKEEDDRELAGGAGARSTAAAAAARANIRRRQAYGRRQRRISSRVPANASEVELLEVAAIANGSTLSSEFRLGPKISDWDEQRVLRSRRIRNTDAVPAGAPAAASMAKEDSILMVTGSAPSACKNPAGDHILLKSIKNKMDYCNLHGIRLFYNLAQISDAMSGFWSKLPLLRELMLAHPEVEWLWWMDSDAFITHMKFELPMARYKNHNLVLHGWEEMVYEAKSWIGVNTGSFLLRNCQWSLDLLDKWAEMGPKGSVRDYAGRMLSAELADRPVFEADDQSALVYLLVNNRRRWGAKVYMETRFCLHGYWLPIVKKFDQMMDDMAAPAGGAAAPNATSATAPNAVRGSSYYGCGATSDGERWPFITHFVGCKPCGRDGDGSYPLSSCLAEMDRTFNFADNQIWQLYGFLHQNLNSSTLVQGHLAGYQNS